MNYARSLLKHLSARLIINGWLPVEDRQMRWTSHQIGFFSISPLQRGCLPFCMQIVFDFFFFCLIRLHPVESMRALWWFLTSQNGSQRFGKSSCPSSSVFFIFFISTFFFFSCLLISNRQIQIWPQQTAGLGTVLGACSVSGSTQMPRCLEELWKCFHQINPSWTSWDKDLGMRIKVKKKVYVFNWAFAHVSQF